MTLATTPIQHARYTNVAQLWDALGNVPLDRILVNPPPGTATEEDVLRLDVKEDRLCELVDGTLVAKTMGIEESMVAIQIAFLLMTFVRPRKLGLIAGTDGTMRILPGRVRMPDVSFISYDRLPGRKSPGVPIPDLTPDLAVEVLSKSNTRREMEIKLVEYFTAGTRLAWYVDLPTRSVDVYTAVDRFEHLDENAMLTGGDVIPGFAARVADLFDVG